MNTGQQQRPSVPSSALVSQARNLDLEWIGIDDSARAVSNEVVSSRMDFFFGLNVESIFWFTSHFKKWIQFQLTNFVSIRWFQTPVL